MEQKIGNFETKQTNKPFTNKKLKEKKTDLSRESEYKKENTQRN